MAAKQAMFLIALAIILLLGFSAVDAGYTAAGTNHSVSSESWTADVGNWTELNNSNIEGALYQEDELVKDSGGAKMSEGTDYQFNNSTGEVKALSGGGLSDGESATISYNYTTYTEHQQGFLALFAGMADPSTVLLIVMAVAVILAGMRFLTGGV